MADQLLFTRTLTGEDAAARSAGGARGARRNRSVRRTVELEKQTSRRSLLILVGGLALIAAVILVFQYTIAPRMLIRTFNVESDLDVPGGTILQIAGVTDRPGFFSLDAAQVVRRLEAWAPVKHATAVKVFPDTLRITVTGRKPVGTAMVNDGGKEFPVAFDDQGVVFASGPEVAKWDLPVFSGIKFQNFNIGVTLPPMLLDFVKEVKDLKMSAPGLYDLISEYRIVPRNDNEFDVLLYPIHHRVAIEIGPHIDRTLCMYILRVLDVMDRQGSIGKLKEIDFRTNDVVYTMDKEG
ncbi:MAG TPA: FtsQ-type POTRA domain-containing protein [Spirochaetia bacterium]|nr:FtsQ-type POTRA domain-containing protein [Spirochaetia bacterium]